MTNTEEDSNQEYKVGDLFVSRMDPRWYRRVVALTTTKSPLFVSVCSGISFSSSNEDTRALKFRLNRFYRRIN